MLTETDKEDMLIEECAKLRDNACKIVALSKKKQANTKILVYIDKDGNDATIKVYDFFYHTWRSTDTFDQLASKLLGDANKGPLLAFFNKIAVESEIEAGTKIKIPVLTEKKANTNNKIYASPGKQDNYGTDIKIDKAGNISVKNGKIETTSGKDNLNQAIALRLSTASNKRIRVAGYGIRSTVGDNVAVNSYLLSTIEQTIIADPRIASIDEITFKGEGDKLELEIVYTDINGETGVHKGVM